MRHLLAALLAIHGVIHLAGFLKWSGLAAVPQLSGRTAIRLSYAGGWVFALLWLGALILLLAAAVVRVAEVETWWALALGGVALSQVLILVAWSDAKAGTIANVLLLLPILAAGAHARWTTSIDAEVRALLGQSALSVSSPVSQSEWSTLPPPVRQWLDVSKVGDHPRVHTVRLRQRGALRTSPDGPWMPAEAQQYFTLEEPAFIWRVEARMFGLPFSGRDRYAAGAGEMLVEAAALVPVIRAKDEKIAHGALLRFLGEIVWFPGAATSRFIEWEAIDEASARATLRHAGLIASAVFQFDEAGRVRGLSAERYLGGGSRAQLTPWSVSCSEWRRFEGIEVPTRGEVSWSLPSGRFVYYQWEILEVEYNRESLYDDVE